MKQRLVMDNILVLAIGAVLVLLAVVARNVVLGSRLPKTVEHLLPSDNPLFGPADATDLCYTMAPDGLAYEFAISEKGYMNWLRQHGKGRGGKEVGAEPVKMRRYKWYQEPNSPGAWVTISNGLVYSSDQGNHGRNYWIYAYDRDTERAYIWTKD